MEFGQIKKEKAQECITIYSESEITPVLLEKICVVTLTFCGYLTLYSQTSLSSEKQETRIINPNHFSFNSKASVKCIKHIIQNKVLVFVL